jgi:hypothetical protein
VSWIRICVPRKVTEMRMLFLLKVWKLFILEFSKISSFPFSLTTFTGCNFLFCSSFWRNDETFLIFMRSLHKSHKMKA